MTLTERMAYIKGLCEGLNIDSNTKEGKVLLSLIDVVEEMAQSVSGLENDMDQVFEELDAIDEDLTDVEDALWEEDDEDEDEYEDWEDYEDDCGCGCGHHHHHHEEDEEEVYDGDIYEITCPKCGEVVCMDEDMLFSPDCACPNCGTSFEVDFDGIETCDCEVENNEDEE